MTNTPSTYLSEAIFRVGMLRRFAPSRVDEFATEAEAATFLHAVTGINEIAPVRNPYGRVVKVSARMKGAYIDLYLP